MLIECPHCFTRVLPRRDGECPSCQRNTLNVRDADRKRVAVIVRENSKMPDYCCTCTLPERRLVRVARSRLVWGSRRDTSFGAAAVSALQLLAGGLHFLIHRLHSDKQSGEQEVVVRMRQCRECSRETPLDPIFVNFDAYTMKFVVPRDFARMFGELNDNDTPKENPDVFPDIGA
jgi:hypothetical protein